MGVDVLATCRQDIINHDIDYVEQEYSVFGS